MRAMILKIVLARYQTMKHNYSRSSEPQPELSIKSRLLTAAGACLLLISLIAMTVYFYWPSLSYPFEFDDLANIVKHFSVRHQTLRDLFFANSRWLSYWLNTVYYSLLPEGHKFEPYVYRLGNLIIHCWAGAAVFTITQAMVRLRSHAIFVRAGNLIPYLTAGLFLLHPVQTQTVSYVIQGQLEGLAGAFMFTTTALFLWYSLSQSLVMRTIAFVLLVLAAIFACGSKEIIIVLPVLIMLTDWFFVAQGSSRSWKSRWWLHALLLTIIVGLYLYLLKPHYFYNIISCSMELPSNIGNLITETRLEKITAGSFFISQGKVMLHYLWIFIWPWSMSMDYDWKLSCHVLSPDCLVPYLALALLVVYLLYRLTRNSRDLMSFCFAWFFIAILPRSSIIPSTELLADYKTYTASFGICLLMALGITALLLWIRDRLSQKPLWPFYVMSVLLLLLVGAAARQRNLVWKSAAAFWSDIIQHAPQRARAYNNYGVALCEEGDNEGAVKNFLHAISLDQFYSDPYANLSVAYTNLKRYKDAINAMRRGICIMPTQPEGYNNLASILINMNDDDEAESLLLQAIRLRPHYGKAHFNLGKWYLKRHRDEEAWSSFKSACMMGDFDNEIGFTMYGHVSMLLKKYEDALHAFNRALSINPGSIELALRRIIAAEQLKRYTNADKWFGELLGKHVSTVSLWINYGDLLMQRPDPAYAQQAGAMYERASKLTSSHVITYKMALAAERSGNKGQALAIASKLQTFALAPDLRREVDALVGSLKTLG